MRACAHRAPVLNLTTSWRIRSTVAATGIQARFRGFLYRMRRRRQAKAERAAAENIQRHFKGFVVRKRRAEAKAKREADLREDAATKIQTAYRGFKARRHFEVARIPKPRDLAFVPDAAASRLLWSCVPDMHGRLLYTFRETDVIEYVEPSIRLAEPRYRTSAFKGAMLCERPVYELDEDERLALQAAEQAIEEGDEDPLDHSLSDSDFDTIIFRRQSDATRTVSADGGEESRVTLPPISDDTSNTGRRRHSASSQLVTQRPPSARTRKMLASMAKRTGAGGGNVRWDKDKDPKTGALRPFKHDVTDRQVTRRSRCTPRRLNRSTELQCGPRRPRAACGRPDARQVDVARRVHGFDR